MSSFSTAILASPFRKSLEIEDSNKPSSEQCPLESRTSLLFSRKTFLMLKMTAWQLLEHGVQWI